MEQHNTAQPITVEQANQLLTDPNLAEHCRRTGVDLGMIVNNLLVDVPTRFKRHEEALRGILAIRKK